MMSNQENLDKYLNFELSDTELHATDISKDVQEVLHQVASFEVPQTISKEEAWNKLMPQLVQETQKEAKVLPLRKLTIYGLAIAAGLAILIGLAAFLNPISECFVAPEGEFVSVDLPDGSSAVLEPASTLSYEYGRLFFQARKIDLEGEAFFDVVPGKPFIVQTSEGRVKVLGTSFIVKSHATFFDVSCLSGKVSVSAPEVAQSVLLTDGNGARKSDDNIFEMYDVASEEKIAWLNEEIAFEKTKLNEVIFKLEENFNVIITADSSTMSRKFTGNLPKKDLVQSLEVLSKSMKLTYRKKNDRTFELSD